MKNETPPRWSDKELEREVLRVYKDFNPPRSKSFLVEAMGLYWQNNHFFPRIEAILERLGLPPPREDGARPLTWQERAALKEGHRRRKERGRIR